MERPLAPPMDNSSMGGASIEPGIRLGHYEIVARLSSGGMASLFLAKRSGVAGFSRHVAIKVVHPHLAENPHFIRMFVDEAKLAVQIQHPNVVHVEELGVANGTYFIVMEYVHGCSLAQLMAGLARLGRRLTPELAVWLALKVADGLHAAHEIKDENGRFLGVVHRDVSPQNILVSANGHIKLIDFGIAKAYGRQYQTVQGSLKGKLKYMAPEQARSSKVDRRTDVYALGIVLWEMLTMRRLFRGENEVELLEKVRSPEIESPRHYFADISPALEQAVMQALQRNPQDRFDNALELLRALSVAVPDSSSVDASLMAELLSTVLGSELQRKSAALPRSATGSIDGRPADVDLAAQLTAPERLATGRSATARPSGSVLNACTLPEARVSSAEYWEISDRDFTDDHTTHSGSHAIGANSLGSAATIAAGGRNAAASRSIGNAPVAKFGARRHGLTPAGSRRSADDESPARNRTPTPDPWRSASPQPADLRSSAPDAANAGLQAGSAAMSHESAISGASSRRADGLTVDEPSSGRRRFVLPVLVVMAAGGVAFLGLQVWLAERSDPLTQSSPPKRSSSPNGAPTVTTSGPTPGPASDPVAKPEPPLQQQVDDNASPGDLPEPTSVPAATDETLPAHYAVTTEPTPGVPAAPLNAAQKTLAAPPPIAARTRAATPSRKTRLAAARNRGTERARTRPLDIKVTAPADPPKPLPSAGSEAKAAAPNKAPGKPPSSVVEGAPIFDDQEF